MSRSHRRDARSAEAATRHLSVPELVSRQAERAPDAIALVDAGARLSYGELERRSTAVAGRLRAAGVASEAVVGVQIERSAAMVVAQLGILKAGGAFLTLESSDPPPRRAALLRDAGALAVVTAGSAPSSGLDGPLELTLEQLLDGGEGTSWTTARPDLGRLAYVIYTSGSSGAPKGVEIQHGSLRGLARWHAETYQIDPGDRASQIASAGFDASVWEIWPYLISGASVHFVDDQTRLQPARLRDWFVEHRITIGFVPTPLAAPLLREEWPAHTALRRLLTGGDRLTSRPPRGLPFELINHYGPTEATVVATAGVVASDGDSTPSIGTAIDGVEAVVLDEELRPVAPDAGGELALGGPALARGYRGRPDLTAERFVPDPRPRAGGRRLYRTGDRVRVVAGELCFLGRLDDQVKVRGFRIEPGEIEAALARHPSVSAAAVVRPAGARLDAPLVAYVSVSAPECGEVELRADLVARLPAHLVPARILVLPSLPLTERGKVDRAALAARAWPEREAVATSPLRTATEQRLAGIWSSLLEVESVGRDDDFFESGGHSLAVTQLLARIGEELGVDLPIAAVFEHSRLGQLAEAVDGGSVRASVGPARAGAAHDEDQAAPLSFPQERVWFLQTLHPDNRAYHFQALLRLFGPLDIGALEAALGELVRRHEIFRTTFPSRDGRPRQQVHEAGPQPLPVIDLSALPGAKRAAEEQEVIRRETDRSFDLTRLPLIRWTLIRLAPQQHSLLQVEHHLLHDGWSFNVLLEELSVLYRAYRAGRASPLLEPQLQFRDFARWQRSWMSGEVASAQLDYWRERLADPPPPLALPTDRPRPPLHSYRGASLRADLPAELATAAREFSREQAGATLFMTMLTAFAALLQRYSGQRDFAVGAGIANRRWRQTESLIGMVVNILPLRLDTSGDPSFAELLRRVRRETLGCYSNQDLPFERIVDELSPRRDLSHNPFFQTAFNFHDSRRASLDFDGLRAELTEGLSNQTAKFDLSVIGIPREQGEPFTLVWEYATDLFDAGFVDGMRRHYQRLLAAGLAEPERPLSQLDILDPEDRELVLARGSGRQVDYPREAGLSRLFEAQVDRDPDAVALRWADRTLGYGELDRRANRLAHRLSTLGVRPGDFVGVLLSRSPRSVESALAILKLGAAYVPLDPDYPSERLDFMARDAGLRAVVTERAWASSLAAGAWRQLCLDREAAAIEACPDSRLGVEPRGAWPAYLMYTSGSTGEPKGACIPQRAVSRLVLGGGYVELAASDRLSQVSNHSFDAATFELWGALLNGARLVGVPREILLAPQALARLIRDEGVNVMVLTTALFHQIAREAPGCFSGLRHLMVGGEALLPAAVREVLEHGAPRRLQNVYGPTENTTYTTTCDVGQPTSRATVPIGLPVGNTSVYVLDEALQPVPPGLPGLLYTGGDGLAIGYWGRPDLTAARFVPDPFGAAPGGRLYRTGDRARFLHDGTLEFLGRADRQVKIRGFRVEPEEVEAILATHPNVRGALVVVRSDPPAVRLVAYVAWQGPLAEARPELKRFLSSRVPPHLVPADLVALERLPLTANGKLDRAALPSPEADAAGPVSERPADPVEAAMVEVWKEVLEVEHVGVDDNFFDLGGDSILSIRLVARLAQRGIRTSPVALFAHQTIAELSRAGAATGAPAALPVPVRERGRPGLLPIQRYFFERHPPGQGGEAAHHWNQSLLLQAAGADPSAVEQALQALWAQHETLRCAFRRDGAEFVAEVRPAGDPLRFELIELESADPALLEREAARLQAAAELERGGLFRAALYLVGGEAHRLLLVAHHLVVDLVSWRVLLDDLDSAYDCIRHDRPPRLAAATTSHRAWAEAVERRAAAQDAAAVDYWRNVLDSASCEVGLGAAGDASWGGAVTVERTLDEATTRALLGPARRGLRLEPQELLLAALGRALGERSGRDACLIALEGHGREEHLADADLSRSVGWFTSVYPHRLETGQGLDPGTHLKRIKQALRRVPERGFDFGPLRWLRPGTGLAERPLPRLAFNYRGQWSGWRGGQHFCLAEGSMGPRWSAAARRMFPVQVECAIVEGRLRSTWVGERDDSASLEHLADAFGRHLGSLVEYCEDPEHVGRTPADFPLVSLSQPEVDRLPGDAEDVWPLAPIQEGILFHALYEPEAPVYCNQVHLAYEGRLNPELYGEAWNAVCAAQPVLRATFHWRGLESPVQVIRPARALSIERHDLSALDEGARREQIDRYCSRNWAQPYDLERGPLLRFAAFEIGPARTEVVWSFHHIVLDGWSVANLMAELSRSYEALLAGSRPPRAVARPFRDYLSWLTTRDREPSLRYWRAQLEGAGAGSTSLAPDHLRTARRRHDVRHVEWSASQAQSDALRAWSRDHRLTVAVALRGLWAALLALESGSDQVAFGVTVSGRPAELDGVEQMIGPFISALPVTAAVARDAGLAELFLRLQSAATEALPHEHAPLAAVLGRGSRGEQGILGSIVVHENFPMDGHRRVLGEARLARAWARQSTHYDLAFVVFDEPMLRLRLIYADDLYEETTAQRALLRLAGLLGAFLENPGAPLAQLERSLAGAPGAAGAEAAAASPCDPLCEPVDPGGREQASSRETPPLLVWERVQEQVRRNPDAIAVEDGASRYSYSELWDRSSLLCGRLESGGLVAEEVVGVLLDHSPELVCSVLAVLRSGGAFLPLDPATPSERLAFMLADAGVRTVIASPTLRARVPRGHLVLEASGEGPTPEPSGGGLGPDASERLAYVMYTSGSTGRPKGVMVTQGGLANYLEWAASRYGLRAGESCVLHSSVAFDLTLTSLLLPLLVGARIVVARASGPAAEGLAAVLRDHPDQALLKLTPGQTRVLSELLSASEQARCARVVVVGGEALRSADVAQWRQRAPDCVIVNEYGPTEAVVGCCAHFLGPGEVVSDPVPIGRAISGTQLHVLDESGRRLPAGARGELWIGGLGLARGYLGRPDLTAERFAPDPFSDRPGARLYRTGDVVRARSDGALEYLGRADDQVKLRGYRVEPGEVEARLREHPRLADVAVVARDEDDGRALLVAYLVPEGASPAPEDQELRSYLEPSLPEYMLPSAFVRLERLPLAANGKLDRGALPAPPRRLDAQVPSTRNEKLIAEVWRRVLRLEHVGIDEDFFELGGDSILGIRVAARLQEAGLAVQLRDLFEHPTVAGLAAVARAGATRAQPDAAADPLPGLATLELEQGELDRLLGSERGG